MTERTTVRLPPDLVGRAKRKAAAEGRTLTALIEDGLRRVLAEERARPAKKKVRIPVSKATGGLQPGIDLGDMSSVQELEDLEYAKRLRKGFR
jgi:hypothetical protein